MNLHPPNIFPRAQDPIEPPEGGKHSNSSSRGLLADLRISMKSRKMKSQLEIATIAKSGHMRDRKSNEIDGSVLNEGAGLLFHSLERPIGNLRGALNLREERGTAPFIVGFWLPKFSHEENRRLCNVGTGRVPL
jgi:hypothetical protein